MPYTSNATSTTGGNPLRAMADRRKTLSWTTRSLCINGVYGLEATVRPAANNNRTMLDPRLVPVQGYSSRDDSLIDVPRLTLPRQRSNRGWTSTAR